MGRTTIEVAPENLAARLLPGSTGRVLGATLKNGRLNVEIESPLLVDAPRTEILYGETLQGVVFIASIKPDLCAADASGKHD